MGILHAAAEMEGVSVSIGRLFSTTAGRFDADFCSGSMEAGSSTLTFLNSPNLASPVSEIWLHAEAIFPLISNTGLTILEIRDSLGNIVARLQKLTGANLQMQRWSGTAFVVVGPGILPSTGTRFEIDVHIKIHASAGVFEWYHSGLLVDRVTGNTVFYSGADVSNFGLGSAASALVLGSTNNTFWSQIILADEDTRGMKLATLRPNAAGSNSGWTGAYTDIAEVGTINDATLINSASVGQVSTFGLSNLSAAASVLYPIAVCVSARASAVVSSPLNIDAAVRVSGTNYFSSSSYPGLISGLGPVLTRSFPLNPATAAPWTAADVNALEAGYRSAT